MCQKTRRISRSNSIIISSYLFSRFGSQLPHHGASYCIPLFLISNFTFSTTMPLPCHSRAYLVVFTYCSLAPRCRRRRLEFYSRGVFERRVAARNYKLLDRISLDFQRLQLSSAPAFHLSNFAFQKSNPEIFEFQLAPILKAATRMQQRERPEIRAKRGADHNETLKMGRRRRDNALTRCTASATVSPFRDRSGGDAMEAVDASEGRVPQMSPSCFNAKLTAARSRMRRLKSARVSGTASFSFAAHVSMTNR